MRDFRRLRHATVLVLILVGVGCSDSNDAPPPEPPPPPPPTFSYSVEGRVVKGVVAGAAVSILDAEGVALANATATTAADGTYSISFTTTAQLAPPLQVVVDGNGATMICDVEPNCQTGRDANGDPVAAGFGDTFELPDGIVLRAPLQSLDSTGDNAFEGTAFVSPLSEFVVASALSMGGGSTLSTEDLDVANQQVALLLASAFPTLEIPQDLTIGGVPLLDLTDLVSAELDSLNQLSIAATAVSASLAGFVDVGSSLRGDLTQVLGEFASQFSENSGELDVHDGALLRKRSVAGLAKTATSLADLVASSAVTLPEGFVVSDLTEIQQAGEDSLPEIVDIWTSLTPGESTLPVESEALGWADLIVLPETGEARVMLETDGLNVTAVHLHEGYAGQNGPILVGLEQDLENPDRWGFPADTILDADTLAALSAGRTYFNVHSEAFPPGELRGQVLPSNIRMILATPNGLEQVPSPIESDGFARGAITLDIETNRAQVHFSSTNIDVIAAHVHQGIAGTNGGVVINMDQNPQVSGHWFAEDVDLTDLLGLMDSARLYFNLHTALNQPGELRSQIAPQGFDVRVSVLTPAQVISDPPVVSSASGAAATTVVMATGEFYVHVNTTAIVDPLAVSLRTGDALENGVLLYELVRDDLDPDHWFVEGQTLTAEQLMMFIEEKLYVEVRTAAWPDGEIRSQLSDASRDTDGDGIPDFADVFPGDPEESADSDLDGVGDNADTFPNDPTETQDSDGDGVGDNADAFPNNSAETTDSDGDGTGDNADQCPTDPSGTVDSDNDGVCDSSEPPTDSDGDGVPDDQDAFPNDSSESADSDGDGVGDNGDAFPNDPLESADADGDGVGDNADAFPNDGTESTDTDGDGVGDNADVFPQDPGETADTDGDGTGDNSDNCPNTVNADQADSDGDGVGDACEVATSPTFAEVQAIFNSRCVACHGVSGGLSLQAPGSFGNLVDVPSSQISTLDRIEPFDPDNSYLVWKIEGRSGIVGSRMPLGGVLSQDDIDLIREWVAAGAENN